MGRRSKHKNIPKDVVAMKYDTNTIIDKQQLSSSCTESTIEEPQLSSIQSSWLPFKWVSRYDANNGGSISKDSNTNTSSHDVNGDSVSKADNTDISSTNQPSHNSLLSELNEIKQQLMPAAKSCADAINDSNSYSTHTTTPEYEFRQARSICNPYESLGLTYSKNESKKKKHKRKRKYNNIQQQSSSGFSQFINRSAIKLANIDALLGFILTSPSLNNEQKQQQQRDEQPDFVFVDLCGAPGGFSEYILYRHVHPATNIQDNDEKKQYSNNSRIPCYGFGMSLLGTNADGKGAQWKLEHLKRYHLDSNNTLNAKNSSASRQKLHYHVCNGADGTGTIYDWDNVLQLQKEITTTLFTDRGDINNNKPLANLVVADGGFDNQRNSNDQESIAHKIIVSQTAAALTLLAPRGTFLLKMFGNKDQSTRQMLHYLYGCFDQLTFVKPVLSRPASAERYLVCRGYTGQSTEWNGFAWRDQMIAGVAAGREAVDDKDTHQLEELLNKFDKEMIQLNINTCQSIVNYLHEKRDAVTNDDSSTYGNQEHSLNLKAYEEAWQLFS